MSEKRWAAQEFGNAALGDTRRTARLVAMASRMAERPAGCVTEVFSDAAEREGAFRFVENEDVDPDAITAAAAQATASRGQGEPFVFVPIDGSSLNIDDTDGRKRLGRVGTEKAFSQGLQVMSAIGVGRDGTPLGILGQHYWTRTRGFTWPRRKGARRTRATKDKETAHWLTVMQQSIDATSVAAPGTRLWFQHDRGADAWPILKTAASEAHWITVRAAWDRRLVNEDAGQRYLWETMSKAPIVGDYALEVTASADGRRTARSAQMVVRSARVTLDLVCKKTDRKYPTEIWAVWALEQGTCPPNEKPIEWMLLTSYEVKSVHDAKTVVYGYSQRWRIEQFHRVWKSGACRVERTQLEDRDHIITWATLLASVAIRIVRLTYLARHKSHEAATAELTQYEIDAAILVSNTKKFRRGQKLTTGEAILLLAQCGGYTGKSSGGPPGALVLARGLVNIRSAALVLEKL